MLYRKNSLSNYSLNIKEKTIIKKKRICVNNEWWKMKNPKINMQDKIERWRKRDRTIHPCAFLPLLLPTQYMYSTLSIYFLPLPFNILLSSQNIHIKVNLSHFYDLCFYCFIRLMQINCDCEFGLVLILQSQIHRFISIANLRLVGNRNNNV